MKKSGIISALAAFLLMASCAAFSQGPDLAMKAYVLRMNGDPHGALAFLDSALLLHPDSARLWFEKGRCMDWIKTEDCSKFTDTWKYLSPRLRMGRRSFNRAIRLDPDNARYHYWAAENAGLRGLMGFYTPWKWPAVPFILAHCVNEAEDAVRLDPENPDYRFALINYSRFGPLTGGSKTKARAHADTLQQLDPVYGVKASRELWTKKHPYNPVSHYLELEPAYPDNLMLLQQLGSYYARKDSTYTEKALYYFKRILEIDPGNITALSELYREMPNRQKDEALPYIESYLRHVDSGYNFFKAPGHRLLGQFYQQKGDQDKARAAYAEAERLNPKNNGSGNADTHPPGK